jgi:nitrogen-specific signal transduction histidine kinase/ABC-type branched-subunit amino acid transport system ATPase component
MNLPVNQDVVMRIRGLTVLKKLVPILHAIDLDFMKGEVHAVVGDHNAGKSLLAKVIAGAATYDAGELVYRGKVLRSYSTVKAGKLGIETIHQNPTVFSYFSVLDNVFMRSVNPSRRELAAMTELTSQKLRSFGVDLDLHAPISRCSDSEILVIYIVRSLCQAERLLVVDDISSMLSHSQTETLQHELTLLRKKGVAIVYLTSNIEEVYRFANKVSFLQGGRILATEKATNLGKLELVQLSYSHLYSRKELERNNFELFYLKNYYENIINSIPIPLLLLNSQRSIVYINSRFSETYGIQKEEYAGKDVMEILRPGTAEYEYFHAGRTDNSLRLMQFPKAALSVGGPREPDNLYIIPISDAESSNLGSILLFDSMGIPVSQELYARTVQAQKRVPLFAHEIRNPLGILRNFLNLMKEKSTSQELRDYLVRSETEIKRINTIIDNLMKEQTDSEPLRPRKMKIWAIAEEIKYLVMPMIAGGRISLVNATDRNLQLMCNEDEIKEVLINLVLNAIESIAQNGIISMSSDVEKVNERSYVVIRVKDNGKGITPKDLERVFEPFFSTKLGGERRGLGLTICKDIVDAWGGMITVDSTIDVGTTASIFLPSAVTGTLETA